MKFDFAKNGKIFAAISGAILVAGLLVTLIFGLNLGIDFTGGSVITLQLEQQVSSAEIEGLARQVATGDVRVTVSENQVEIRVQDSDMSEEDLKTLLKEITTRVEEKYTLTSDPVSDRVGAIAGDELVKNALTAIIVASILMLIYIAIRFEFFTGMAALAALLHDVLLMVAIMAFLRVQINSSFIAAVLTILGYSINNTIVIFDRIRENRRRFGGELSSEQVVNRSIRETLNRTMNTTITTLITLLAVYILGVPSIREFTLPLLIGLIGGTYSAIFLSGPIWLFLHNQQNKRREAAKNGAKKTKKPAKKTAKKSTAKKTKA